MTTGVTRETHVEGVVTGGRTPRSNTSWGAIWAGFFVTLAVETLFSLLMIGIFASFVHPGGGGPSGLSFGIGIAIWFFLQTLGAFYCGGWVAGMLARRPDSGWNSLHGWAVWGLSMVVMVYLFASAAGPSWTGTLNNMRFGLGMQMTSVSAPANMPSNSVAGTVSAIGGGAQAAGANGNLAMATWIPIYLFITFGIALGTALSGSSRGSAGNALVRRYERAP
ncbi:MAG TPA: hypothetical protein VKT72_11525 [Candidatus Baltobacteraceae bacterium]|nr:hypothetical protein [Candidatus Baltobacteraceae bacterium]